MIKAVLEHYFPYWDSPEDYGNTWESCECPVHDDNTPSASVSYELDAFNCHSCGYSGDYLKVIEQEEGCNFVEAQRVAAGIAEERGIEVPRESRRKPRRGVPRPKKFGA